jgi:hypothetical protein
MAPQISVTTTPKMKMRVLLTLAPVVWDEEGAAT